jgi:hypothetical protein
MVKHSVLLAVALNSKIIIELLTCCAFIANIPKILRYRTEIAVFDRAIYATQLIT